MIEQVGIVIKKYLKQSYSKEEELLVAEAEKKYKYYAEMRKKKFNSLTIMLLGVFSLIFSMTLFLVPSDVLMDAAGYAVERLLSKDFFVFIFAVSISMYAASLFFNYLNPGEISKIESEGEIGRSVGERLRVYERKLASVEGKYQSIIEKLQGGGIGGEIFSEDERKGVLSDLRAKLESDAHSQYFDALCAEIRETQKYKQREDVFARTVSRLEIQNQSRRGNVNLWLGIITTIFGVIVLGYSVLRAPTFTGMAEVMSHFLPRLSLVVVIEVFAYFFLRLYKQSLDEIKFFQNEMTNVESKYLGLYVASEAGCDDGVLNVINELASTERNFILEKGQSTVSLEQKKMELASNAATAGGLAGIVSDYLKKR